MQGSAPCPEISPGLNSVQILQKSFRWDCKFRFPIFTRMQKDPPPSPPWKILQSMSEFSGLQTHENNPACTKQVWAFRLFKMDTIQKKADKNPRRKKTETHTHSPPFQNVLQSGWHQAGWRQGHGSECWPGWWWMCRATEIGGCRCHSSEIWPPHPLVELCTLPRIAAGHYLTSGYG